MRKRKLPNREVKRARRKLQNSLLPQMELDLGTEHKIKGSITISDLRRKEIDAQISAGRDKVGRKKRSNLFTPPEARQVARQLSMLFHEAKIFDTKRGFATKKDVYTKEKGRVGIDSQLYSLMINGLGEREMTHLVEELLSLPKEAWTQADVRGQYSKSEAMKIYKKYLREKLIETRVFPKKFFEDININKRIGRRILAIIETGLRRERSYRKQREMLQKRFGPKQDPVVRAWQRFQDRGDIIELKVKGLKMSRIRDIFEEEIHQGKIKLPKPKNPRQRYLLRQLLK
jgi:hypothetical protein